MGVNEKSLAAWPEAVTRTAGLSSDGTGAYRENNLKVESVLFTPALNMAAVDHYIHASLEHKMTRKGLNDNAKR